MKDSMYSMFASVPVSTGVLCSALPGLRAPQARLALLQQRGELIPLRRNLYLCSDGRAGYSRGLIANHLLAPSYVSYETVLFQEGLIPERVHVVKSSCLTRSRRFENATGVYDYIRVPQGYYAVGVTMHRTEQGYVYLRATPEKALCDLVLDSVGLRLQSRRAAGVYLDEFLRMDQDARMRLNPEIVAECADASTRKSADLKNIALFLSHERL